jgi:hypothetical protein
MEVVREPPEPVPRKVARIQKDQTKKEGEKVHWPRLGSVRGHACHIPEDQKLVAGGSPEFAGESRLPRTAATGIGQQQRVERLAVISTLRRTVSRASGGRLRYADPYQGVARDEPSQLFFVQIFRV